MDLNIYPLRIGKDSPYPSPWIIYLAKQLDLPFCFGDDSHSPDTVGVGIDLGREYLLEQGIDTITTLIKRQNQMQREVISLK